MAKLSNSAKLRTRRRPLVRKYMLHVSKKFLSETSLHGLKYVGNDTLTIWERLFFLAAFVALVFFAFNLSLEVYNKWDSTPIIIGQDAHTTVISSVPFPAITICNMNQAKYSKVAGFSNDSLDYVMLQKSCGQSLNYSAYSHLKPKSSNDTVENFIVRNAQTCREMLLWCNFVSRVESCTDLFTEVLRDEGLCCVFNAVHPFYLYKGEYHFIRDYTSSSGRIPVDWDPELGFIDKELPKRFYPRLARGEGADNGLSVVINANVDDYYCSSTNGAGFKVTIHNPIDTPHIKESGLPIMIGSETRMRITVSSSTALQSIRSSRPEHRQCLFDDERELRYFKYYTRQNCEMECDAGFMLRSCDCIPYYMPLLYDNATVCHVQHFECITVAGKYINTAENFACKEQCLPGCYNLEYLLETFFTDFSTENYYVNDAIFHNISKRFMRENLAQVHFYFKDSVYRSRVKTTYTGFTEYLSLTGGIMSLMMGFSVISITETVYYAILRPVFDFLLKRPPWGAVVKVQSAENLSANGNSPNKSTPNFRRNLGFASTWKRSPTARGVSKPCVISTRIGRF